MDFDVTRTVRITELGVYDDFADGLSLPLTAVALRPRKPADAGDAGIHARSPRHPPGQQPLQTAAPAGRLAGRVQRVIAVSGYGPQERYFSNAQNLPQLQVFSGGSLLFVGSGRYGAARQFPNTPDTGPVNRYAGGTFCIEPLAEAPRISDQPGRAGGQAHLDRRRQAGKRAGDHRPVDGSPRRGVRSRVPHRRPSSVPPRAAMSSARGDRRHPSKTVPHRSGITRRRFLQGATRARRRARSRRAWRSR